MDLSATPVNTRNKTRRLNSPWPWERRVRARPRDLYGRCQKSCQGTWRTTSNFWWNFRDANRAQRCWHPPGSQLRRKTVRSTTAQRWWAPKATSYFQAVDQRYHGKAKVSTRKVYYCVVTWFCWIFSRVDTTARCLFLYLPDNNTKGLHWQQQMGHKPHIRNAQWKFRGCHSKCRNWRHRAVIPRRMQWEQQPVPEECATGSSRSRRLHVLCAMSKHVRYD